YQKEVWVSPDGKSRSTVYEKRKILSDRGKERFSEVQWPYESDSERVTLEEAKTVDAEGREIPVQPNAVKDSSPFAEYPAYDRTKVRTFTFPALTKGATTEYRLKIENDKPMLDASFADSFLFHPGQPALKSRYVLHLPKGLNLKYRILNPAPEHPIRLQIKDEGDRLRYEWEAQNLPDSGEEERMPSPEDLLPRLLLTTAESWAECSRWYLRLNGEHAEPTPEIKALAARLTRGLSGERAKAQALYHWVIENVRYISVSMGDAGYEAQSAEEVLRNRYGDCKDGSTLVIALFRSLGIRADYALLSTNDEATVVEDLPSLYQFNHCIVAATIEGKKVFLDSVGKTNRFGSLPEMDHGVRALVLTPNPTFFPLPAASPGENFSEKLASIQLARNGDIRAEVSFRFGGEEEAAQREAFKDGDPEASVQEALAKEATDAELLSYQTDNLQDLERPFGYRARYRAQGVGQKAGNLLLFRIPGLSYDLGPFDTKGRSYPLRPLNRRQVEKVRIQVPPGYLVRHLPPPLALDSPFASFRASYRKVQNQLCFEAVTEYKNAPLLPEEYPRVRGLFLRRARFAQEPVLLEAPRTAIRRHP
ncbi:MAG: DUF3857 domain-containing transglutaminase family protein, partial [Bacteroidota bacterium]